MYKAKTERIERKIENLTVAVGEYGKITFKNLNNYWICE